MSDITTITQPLMEASQILLYRRALLRHIRQFWRGQTNRIEFTERMIDTVRNGLTKAFRMGLRDVGLKPREATPEEWQQVQLVLDNQYQSITGLADHIFERQKAKGYKFSQVVGRLSVWVNQFDSVRETARLSGEANPKLKWVISDKPGIDHCSSCLKLNGKVKRKSYWLKKGVQPKNPPNNKLICGGWQCHCVFQITDEPLTKGPLPKLP